MEKKRNNNTLPNEHRTERVTTTDYSEADVRAELHRVVSSAHFAVSERNRRFLEYVVEETLAGRSARLKAYNIATIVFGRPDSFDAQLDPVVRMEAGRMRRALDRFYLVEGAGPAGVRIGIPTGGYVPEFHSASADSPAAEPADQQHALSITVEPFGAEGDLSALNNLNNGLTQQIIIGLHQRGERVVCGSESGRCHSEGSRERTIVAPDHTLTGGMAVVGDTLNVTALLLDSSTGRVIWGKNLLRQIPSGLILAGRDEIAEHIAGALHDFLSARVEGVRRQMSGKMFEK